MLTLNVGQKSTLTGSSETLTGLPAPATNFVWGTTVQGIVEIVSIGYPENQQVELRALAAGETTVVVSAVNAAGASITEDVPLRVVVNQPVAETIRISFTDPVAI